MTQNYLTATQKDILLATILFGNKMKERFILQKSQTQPNGWVCTDQENLIMCIFENGKFNDTQQFTIFNDIEKPDANKLARIANEMAEWLRENHYDKIF